MSLFVQQPLMETMGLFRLPNDQWVFPLHHQRCLRDGCLCNQLPVHVHEQLVWNAFIHFYGTCTLFIERQLSFVEGTETIIVAISTSAGTGCMFTETEFMNIIERFGRFSSSAVVFIVYGNQSSLGAGQVSPWLASGTQPRVPSVCSSFCQRVTQVDTDHLAFLTVSPLM